MSDLDELQKLLLGNKKEVLEELYAQLRDPGDRARFLGEVLPEAVQVAKGGDERLVQALQGPVTHCIQQSVKRDSQVFADALYPAMGPAIRKSITETLKQFVQSLNQVLEHSFSVKGLRWRWEAWRNGVPFAQVVLKNTLLFRVEESYLIHRETGLLLEYVSAEADLQGKDQDAVSAMLTAIQDFVQDTFSGSSEGDLETLEMGERILWVMRGRSAMMACAISGIPPMELRNQLRSILEQIHLSQGDVLDSFDGNRESLHGIADMLRATLVAEAREEQGRKRRPWAALAVIFTLLAGLLGGTWYLNHDPLGELKASYTQALMAEPGVVVLYSASDGGLRIRGMRDPLARDPALMAQELGLDPQAIDLNFAAFQSLDPEFVERRIRRLLQPPAGVEVNLQRQVLRISGHAPPAWVDRIRAGILPPASVDKVDISGLQDDQLMMQSWIQEILQPPEGVESVLRGRDLHISGTAPEAWLARIPSVLQRLAWLRNCDTSQLESREWEEVKAIHQELARVTFKYAEGVSMTAASMNQLELVTDALQRLQALLDELNGSLRIRLVGHSDGVGTQAWNIWLRQQRAEGLRQVLQERGGLSEHISVEADPVFTPAAHPDQNLRRVDLHLNLGERPPRADRACR